MISLIWGLSRISKFIKTICRRAVSRGWGEDRVGRIVKGYTVSVQSDIYSGNT